jgi:uncharacterized repeat protein (TIGR01451 family)/LPXTG-motif cell wall-anchored protein
MIVGRQMTRTGSFFNAMTISQSSVTDPDLTNNYTHTTVEVPAANLRVTASADDVSLALGQRVRITISASSLGPETTTTAYVTSDLPAGLSYVSSTASLGTYNQTTGAWAIGTLQASEPAETLVIVAEATAVGSIVSHSSISATTPYELDPSDNSASIAFVVSAIKRPAVDVPLDSDSVPANVPPDNEDEPAVLPPDSEDEPAVVPPDSEDEPADVPPSTGASGPPWLLAFAFLLAFGFVWLLIYRRRRDSD